MKKLEINTKLEGEIKECTFTPKLDSKNDKDRRSFERVYNDIFEYHKKANEKKE